MAKYGNWFENAKNVLAKIANISADGDTFTGSWIAGTTTTYSADGAISVNDDIAELNGFSATCQMTLGDASVSGKRLVIACFDATNTCDVDASFYTGESTATFATGASIELVSLESDSTFYWVVVGNEGVTLT